MGKSKRWTGAAALALLMAAAAAALAAPAAEWTYPLSAALLENRNGNLTLVNREEALDADFTPQNLVPLQLPSVSGPHELRREAAAELAALFDAAAKDGFELFVKSSYRSYQTQNTMYQNRLERYGRDDGVVARPGTSDHQTGLGVDVLNREWSLKDGMTPAFGDTAEARWMEANCARFGFIIRYLSEKQQITGIIYEPWHLRYVGRDVAAYVMENRLSMEEFVPEYRAAIAAYEAAGGDFAELVRTLNAPPPVVEIAPEDGEGDTEVSIGS